MVAALAAVVLMAAACNDYGSKIDELQKRADELKSYCETLETNAKGLETMIGAVQAADELVSFVPIVENGAVVGFKAVFKDAGEVVLYNQESDISVGESGGKYYWMAGGEWLLDKAGNKIEISPETPLPQFSAEGGVLQVSVDGGASWQRLGQIDKNLIASVVEDEAQVVIMLSGGASIVLPKPRALTITLSGDNVKIAASQSVTVGYTVTGEENPAINVLCGDGWSAAVAASGTTAGTITVTAPKPITDDKVIVFASDGQGRMVAVEMRLTIDHSGDTPEPPDPPQPEMVLRPQYEVYYVGCEQTDVEVSVLTNVEYTVATDSEWLQYIGTKAERTDKLSFVVSRNEAAAARAAKATLTSGNYSTSVVFKQEAAPRKLVVTPTQLAFSNEGGSGEVTVTTNIDYSCSASESWVNVSKSGGKITVSVAANGSVESRSATVTFTGEGVESRTVAITQTGVAKMLEVAPAQLAFTSEGGSGEVTVTTNIDYSCSASESWVTISKSGSKVTVNVDANASVAPRSATVTFSGEGVESRTVSVSQTGMAKMLDVSPAQLEFGGEGGSAVVTVTTNINFSCSASQAWVNFSKSGNNVTVIVDANGSVAPRSATVTFSGEGVESRTVSVSQTGMAKMLEVAPAQLTFGSEGGRGTIAVNANVPFSASSSVDWISVRISGTKATVSVVSNSSLESRSGTVTFSGEGVESRTVTVTQSGAEAYLTISDDELWFTASGGTRSIIVYSNIDFSVNGGESWVSASCSGSRIVLTVDANEETVARSASYTVTGEGVEAVEFTIYQEEYIPIEPTPVIPYAIGSEAVDFYISGGDHQYRYGSSIIRNSDGSLDMWTTKEGRYYINTYAAYCCQEKGSSFQVDASHSIAQYFNVQHSFMRVMVDIYGTNTSDDAFTLSLYRWAGSVAATLASTPLNSTDFSGAVKTTGNRYSIYNAGNKMLPAGEYMWAMSGATSGIGVYANEGAGTIYLTDAVSYLDGSAVNDWNYRTQLRGSTSNYSHIADTFVYWHSTDGGITWSEERDVLYGTEGKEDSWSVCDPGVAYFGGWYYIAYTSAPSSYGGKYNHCYVARSKTPVGPWYKWNGSGWGGDPAKVIKFNGTTSQWGAGEPCIVVLDNTVYFYYTWSDSENGVEDGPTTRLAMAPVSEDWPAHLVEYGTVIDKAGFYCPDSSDIKYIEDYGLFYAFHTYNRVRPNSAVAVWTSPDGKHFTYRGDMTGDLTPRISNMGVSGDGMGHIRLADPVYFGYAYQSGLEGFQWSSRFSPMYFGE